MKKLSFREAQLGAYGVLKFLDRLCRDNKLSYFLMYGSLIGAIRHKGIIPWDDDIDIMMPRPDYDKLIQICKNKKIYPFKLFENSIVPEYPHPIARMSDQRYRIVFDNEKDYDIGLFVDIYPLDGVGNDFEKAHKLIRRANYNASLCFLTSRKKFDKDNTNSFFRMLLKLPAYAWANFFGNSHYLQKSNLFCRENEYEKSEYVSGVAQPWREKKGQNKNIYKKEWFDVIEVFFEKDMFYAPRGYDEILKMGYGEYMIPLPENERSTHHSYVAYLRNKG